jgi:AcrR family transcriptional regulator
VQTPLALSGTRRERLRAELTAQIKAVAIAQLEAAGPAGVSLRGIAREVGVSPAALYGYFDSIDDLFTALIVDAYNDIADAVESAVAARPPDALGERLWEGIQAYRAWALANPSLFRLLYFTPGYEPHFSPGDEPPDEGEALTAALRVFVPMLATMLEGYERGLMKPPPSGPHVDTSKFREHFGLDLTPDQLARSTKWWTEFHGFVALEINGHIDPHWVDAEALFAANVRSSIREMGLPLDDG